MVTKPTIGQDDWGTVLNAALDELDADVTATASVANGAIPASQKGAASGVATLGVDGKVPDGQVPSGLVRSTEKGAASGVATLGADSKIPDAQIPAAITRDTELVVKPEVRRYVAGAWQVRGSSDAGLTVFWLKPTSTDPDPPIDATYFLAGTDVLIKAT